VHIKRKRARNNGKKKRNLKVLGGDYDEHNTQATTAEKLTAEDAIQNDRNYR